MFSSSIKKFFEIKKYPCTQLKAVFFDMDGVLFDSMKNHASSWVRAMNDVMIPFTVNEAYMNEGRTGHSTIDGAFNREFSRNASEEEKQHIYKLKSQYFEACEESGKMPYALELLEKIKSQSLEIFLVTGSGQPSLLDNLQVHFPKIFHKGNMITAFDVKHGKPFPEPYLKALEKSGYQPWEVVVIENAPLGVESSSAAGIYTIGVNTGPLDKTVLEEGGANIVLDSIEDLFNQWNNFVSEWNQSIMN